MKKSLLVCVAGIALSSPAAATVYTVNLAGGGASAVGSITTDGTLGVLTQANVTDWQLDLNDGGGSFALNGTANSEFQLIGTGLSASAGALSFDFGAVSYALFQNPFAGSGINFLCLAGDTVCGGGNNRVSISVNEFGGGFAQRGVVQIGSVTAPGVPEPATWAMLIAGFGLVGAAMRRKPSRSVHYRFA